MNAYGTVDLAALTEQITEREVYLHRVAVHLQHTHETFDGLVRLLVEEIIEARKKVPGKRRRRGGAAAGVARGGRPAGAGRGRRRGPRGRGRAAGARRGGAGR